MIMLNEERTGPLGNGIFRVVLESEKMDELLNEEVSRMALTKAAEMGYPRCGLNNIPRPYAVSSKSDEAMRSVEDGPLKCFRCEFSCHPLL